MFSSFRPECWAKVEATPVKLANGDQPRRWCTMTSGRDDYTRRAAGSWEEEGVLPVGLQVLQTGLQVI